MSAKAGATASPAKTVKPMLKLPNVEPKLISYILDEVIENRPHVKFDDIGMLLVRKNRMGTSRIVFPDRWSRRSQTSPRRSSHPTRTTT